MKRIYKQLIKLFPDVVISIMHDISTYYMEYKDNTRYKVYFDNSTILNSNFSKECNTLKELDKYLADKIKDYKQIYK